MQFAEFSNLQHRVCCKLLDSASWVLIYQQVHLLIWGREAPPDKFAGPTSVFEESSSIDQNLRPKAFEL